MLHGLSKAETRTEACEKDSDSRARFLHALPAQNQSCMTSPRIFFKRCYGKPDSVVQKKRNGGEKIQNEDRRSRKKKEFSSMLLRPTVPVSSALDKSNTYLEFFVGPRERPCGAWDTEKDGKSENVHRNERENEPDRRSLDARALVASRRMPLSKLEHRQWCRQKERSSGVLRLDASELEPKIQGEIFAPEVGSQSIRSAQQSNVLI
jgi:hypothetical protein